MFAHQPHKGFTGSLSRAGLAEGTSANTFQILAPNGAGVDYAINGLLYHKADTDNIAFSSGHAAQADKTYALYLVQIDSAGTVSTKKGDDVSITDFDDNVKALHWPEPDDNKAALGAIRVKNETGATWTAGTNDLGAANVTDTYYNFVGGGPARPLTA